MSDLVCFSFPQFRKSTEDMTKEIITEHPSWETLLSLSDPAHRVGVYENRSRLPDVSADMKQLLLVRICLGCCFPCISNPSLLLLSRRRPARDLWALSTSLLSRVRSCKTARRSTTTPVPWTRFCRFALLVFLVPVDCVHVNQCSFVFHCRRASSRGCPPQKTPWTMQQRPSPHFVPRLGILASLGKRKPVTCSMPAAGYFLITSTSAILLKGAFVALWMSSLCWLIIVLLLCVNSGRPEIRILAAVADKSLRLLLEALWAGVLCKFFPIFITSVLSQFGCYA